MDPDPLSYVLSDDESRLIFERDIVPAELGALAALPSSPAASGGGGGAASLPLPSSSSDASPPPLAVFIIGQTGAGKTRAAPLIKSAMIARLGGGHGSGTERLCI
ncbi:hypothetical protein GGS23DRAFT_591919 [Durotheca rogersii]|uniref:uncharacterized protein n=1 Tax=Durotheca rogersii TaxID=419775 RepID=UPI00221EC185|nr:uncharacterized protein GGS23DRAFT_591919 [Durotheca rogersii]KAI5868119.1 hypothetical protein GGS23DRAFT_591919 [Durotheca rogersii]